MRTFSRNKALFLAVNATLLAGLHSAQANSFTWNSTADQNWTTPGNWAGNLLPDLGDTAYFLPTVVPPSHAVNINSGVNLGALVDGFNTSGSLNINGSGTLTLFGQTVTVPQVNGSITQPNVILANTTTTSSSGKDLTLGSSLNIVLNNSSNLILGGQGGTSKSAFGNNIIIAGTLSEASGVHAQLTFYGNGNFQNLGGVLSLTGTENFSGGMVIGSADGLNGGEVVVNSNNNIGSGSIVVNDQSQLTFNKSGTYGASGQLLVVNGTGMLNNNGSSGAFRTGAASIVWAGDVSIGTSLPADATNGFVVLSSTGSNVMELSGKFTGTGSIQKQGGGTLLISGTNNDATGAVQVGNGVLTVAPGSSMPTGDLIMLQSSTNTGVALDLYNSLQNVGNLSSGFTQNSGTTPFTQFINIGSSSTGGQLNIKQTANKIFGYGAANIFTSTITGPGSVSLDAASTAALTFTGPNLYQGGTVINGGTLNLANGSTGSATGTGTITVNSGGNLSTGHTSVFASNTLVNGATVAGPVVVNSGGNLYPGGGNNAGSLTLGGLIAPSGSSLNFDLIGGTNASFDNIDDTASLSIADVQNSVKILGSKLAIGTYQLINFNSGGSLDGSWGTFTPSTNPGGNGRSYTLTLDNNGLSLSITDTASERFWTLTGNTPLSDGSGNWAAGATTFFNTGPNQTNAPYDNTANTTLFIGNGGPSGTITLTGNVRVGGALVLGATSDQTGYTIQPSTSQTLQLAGGIAASNNASITAPIILEGSQTFTVDSVHTVSISGGISETGGPATLTKDDAGTLVLSGVGSYTGGTVINNGVLVANTSAIPAAGGVTNNAALVFSQSSNGTYSGDISGSGSVAIAGSSSSVAIALSGNNNYSGATVLQSGILAISSPAGVGTGTIQLNNGTLRTDADVTLPVTNKSVSLVPGASSTIDTNGHTLTLNNILNGGGNLTKAGDGTLVIGGIHTTDIIGQLAIAQGAVDIAPPSSVSYGMSASSSGGTWVGDFVFINAIELRLQGGKISGGGAIRIKPSTVQITAQGPTEIDNNIILNDNPTPIAGFLFNIGAKTSDSVAINGVISGQSDVDFTNGAGSVSLGAVNTYTGATTIDTGLGGEVQINIDNTLPQTTAVHVTSSGVLDLNGHQQTIASLDATSSAASATVVNGTSSSSTPSMLTINGAATTTYNGFFIDGASSTLGLTLASANTGNLTMAGTLNTYTGGTYINGGTLTVSADVNLGGDAGTLAFGGGALVVTSAFNTPRPITVNPGVSTLDVGAGNTVGLQGSSAVTWAGGTLNVIDSGTLAIAQTGSVSVSAGSTLGVGTTTTVTVDGTTDPFSSATNHAAIVNNGTFALTTGTITIAQHSGGGTLSITGGSTLKLAQSSPKGITSSTGVLSMDSASTLDLTNNSMVVDYSGAYSDVRSLVKGSYNNNQWNLPGIISSLAIGASPNTAVGYAAASDLHISSFGGVSLDANSVIVKYTYAGDSNLDGKVDVTDLGSLASNWQKTGDWVQGDFNYDGSVNVTDLGILASNWQQGASNPLAQESFQQALDAVGLGNVSVPEPTALAALLLFTWPLKRPRR